MNGFDSVEEALEELRNGKIILVTDDPDRENEGDFICAAEFATTENINFMGYGSFSGLTSLKDITIPKTVKGFYNNENTADKFVNVLNNSTPVRLQP